MDIKSSSISENYSSISASSATNSGELYPVKSDELLDLKIGDTIENPLYSNIFSYNNDLEQVTVKKLSDNEFSITGTIPNSYSRKRDFKHVNVTLELDSNELESDSNELESDSNDIDFDYHLVGRLEKKGHLWKTQKKKVTAIIVFTGEPSTKRRRRIFESSYEEADILGFGIRKRKSKKHRKHLSKKKKTKAHKKNKKTRKH